MDNHQIINITIQEQVYQIIRREVMRHVFRAGEQLKEEDLAKRFNVSRSPVREALHRLVGDGFLTILPNRGIFVRKFTPQYILDTLDFRLALEKHGLNCAKNGLADTGRENLHQMRSAMEALLQTKSSDAAKQSALDASLHRIIVDLSDNMVIGEFADKIAALSTMFCFRTFQIPKQAAEAQRENIQIIDIILNGDMGKASQLCEEHINHIKMRLIEEIESGNYEI